MDEFAEWHKRVSEMSPISFDSKQLFPEPEKWNHELQKAKTEIVEKLPRINKSILKTRREFWDETESINAQIQKIKGAGISKPILREKLEHLSVRLGNCRRRIREIDKSMESCPRMRAVNALIEQKQQEYIDFVDKWTSGFRTLQRLMADTDQ